MPTTLPTRQQVDAAGALDFNTNHNGTPKADLLITIRAAFDGFPIELVFSDQVDHLPRLVKRLRELGATPQELVSGPAQNAPNTPTKPARKAQEPPEYNDAGEECCPHHHRTLRGPNQWGKLYCTAKDGDSYCKYTWKAE